MTGNPNPTLLLSSSTLEGALSKEALICQPMERFPKVPNSSSDASLSTSAMANTDNNKGKKKAGNGNRRNNREVKLSTDPQSVAARERRHRISERFKILQSLIPGGTKMDTASMLEEAIHYVKFLKTQIWLHQAMMGTMAEDIRLPPLPPSLYFLSNSLNPQDSSVPPTSAELEQPITPSPSLPLYRYQADENHEAMFSNISINK